MFYEHIIIVLYMLGYVYFIYLCFQRQQKSFFLSDRLWISNFAIKFYTPEYNP